MIGWLPRFAVGAWEGYDAFDRDDAEGRSLSILWFGWTIEIIVARRPRPPRAPETLDAFLERQW